MTTFILSFLLAVSVGINAVSPAAFTEFNRGNIEKFSTKGHSKAKGTSFTIKHPKSWIAQEGERANTVQMFVSEQGKGFETAMILTKALRLPAGTKLTKEEATEILKEASLRKSLPSDATFLGVKSTKIEGEPASILEYETTGERAGKTITLRVVALIFFQGATLVQIQFSVASLAVPTDLQARAIEFRPLFDLMMNSIVFEEKWK
jgi:hypothetical protein